MELATSNARLDSVIALGRAMNEAQSPVDLAESVAEEILGALPAASVSISRVEPDRGILRTLVNVGDLASWEERRPSAEVYPVEECEVLLDPAVLAAAVYDRDDPDCPPSESELLRSTGKRTSLNVAILFAGRAWGELCATRRDEDPPFTSADLSYAEAVAGFVALAFAQADHAAHVTRLVVEDALTGLGNRRAADAALDAAFDDYRATGAPVAVVLCDVNDLKQVNDREGHQAGDDFLRRVASVVAAAASTLPRAQACRIGGDEFCLVAPTGHRQAALLGELICRDTRRWPDDVAVAVGVAASDSPGIGVLDTPAALLRLADAAQYRAKRTRSPWPVQAGWPVPTAEASSRIPTSRRTGGRAAVPESTPPLPTPAFAAAAAVLDELAGVAGGPGTSAPEHERERLVAVARIVARVVAAAAWRLSRLPPSTTGIEAVAGMVLRRPDGGAADEVFEPPAEVHALAPRAMTAVALDGRSFASCSAERDIDGSIEPVPVELDPLGAAGYCGVVGAAVRAPSGTAWLLEVYVDALSRDVDGLDVLLPGLLALGVLPVPAAPGGGLPRPAGATAAGAPGHGGARSPDP